MFYTLRKAFFGDTPVKPVVPEIAEITIGRTVEINRLALDLRGEDGKFSLPTRTLAFVAQGIVALDEGVFLHRFYTEDNTLLQILTSGREGEIREMTVFVPLESVYPSRQSQIDEWRERIRQTSFRLDDGTVYHRLWFENSMHPEDPVQFVEEVYDERMQKEPPRRISQTCMLFSRALAGGDPELLLTILERHDSEETTVELMVGIPLGSEHITA